MLWPYAFLTRRNSVQSLLHFPPKLSNDGHFTTSSHLHSPLQIIVVISKIESLDYLPGYDGLGRIWSAINSRQVWYVLPWLYLLISWRTMDWHLNLLVIQEYSLIDSDSVSKRFPVPTSYRKIFDELWWLYAHIIQKAEQVVKEATYQRHKWRHHCCSCWNEEYSCMSCWRCSRYRD